MRSGWAKVGLPGAAIVALAIGFFFHARSDRASPGAAPAVQAVPVIATKVGQRDVPIILTGLGTVTALNAATIQSQITGLLISVDFREGQSVKKGDMLAQIDPRTNQAQLEQAQATLEHDQAELSNAQLNLRRYTQLAKTDATTQQTLDNQQATVEQLEAQIKSDQAAVDNAQAQLSYTRLVAPFDGVTGIRLLDVGNIIHPPTGSAATQSSAAASNALVVVTQVQPISVIFTFATTDISQVQAAMAKGPLQAMAWSQDNKTELDVGQLAVVNNQADPSSGTIQLKAIFPNAQRQLWPGTFVNVRLVVATEHNALTIPIDAVQQGPQGSFVFVVGQDNKATVRPVSVRQSFGGEALVEKGLSVGETVVLRGQYRLTPGTLVTSADPNNPEAVPNPSTKSSGMLP
jgi:membrane fusion protein, multidrug efflux system